MVKNASVFKEFVERENFKFDFYDERIEETIAVSNVQRLEKGINTRLFVSFNEDNLNTVIEARNFVSGVNARNRGRMLEVTNKLSNRYLFLKFITLKDDIKISLVNSSEGEFDPSNVISGMSDICSVIVDVYEEFMEAMWS